jgi:hypothetical protein
VHKPIYKQARKSKQIKYLKARKRLPRTRKAAKKKHSATSTQEVNKPEQKYCKTSMQAGLPYYEGVVL